MFSTTTCPIQPNELNLLCILFALSEVLGFLPIPPNGILHAGILSLRWVLGQLSTSFMKQKGLQLTPKTVSFAVPTDSSGLKTD